ncbi:hypothetical protein GGQ99_005217 [Aminobacter niigataensis]|uniref:Uncharacterized protein n=1 Tax=Aminobacter niigataensis TaxID=83265 RepID=A0ABR6L9D2_9HYPH|nr:hypothetical protein [Aminobacter niigataensis]MBB4653426.1 hypothetical protein [Aminobacter niigataensis]
MLGIPKAFLMAACAVSPLTLSSVLHAQTNNSPVGMYLWFPGPAGPKSDNDCQALVDKVKPSREKVEQWLWGRMPNGSQGTDDLYLVLTETRMEPTFSAEGDFDFGDVKLGPTRDGETSFTLVPDEHPGTTISGTIVAKPGGQIVTVTLRGIPLDDGKTDRTVYYCRFDEPMTET